MFFLTIPFPRLVGNFITENFQQYSLLQFGCNIIGFLCKRLSDNDKSEQLREGSERLQCILYSDRFKLCWKPYRPIFVIKSLWKMQIVEIAKRNACTNPSHAHFTVYCSAVKLVCFFCIGPQKWSGIKRRVSVVWLFSPFVTMNLDLALRYRLLCRTSWLWVWVCGRYSILRSVGHWDWIRLLKGPIVQSLIKLMLG